jgi:hypothetical protein
VSSVQVSVLVALLDRERIDRLIEQETAIGPKAYTATEMLHDLQSDIFTELATGSSIDVYRRHLQNVYVGQLTSLLGNGEPSKIQLNMRDDEFSIVKTHAKELAATIKDSALRYPKSVTRAHLEDLYERLELSLKPRS